MERYDIRRLALLMNETGLTSLEVRDGSFSVRMERGAANAPASSAPPAPEAQAEVPSPAEPAQKKELVAVSSPMVGVFYAAPGPEEAPFVSIGDRVKPGDTLCVIEAMKLMNEITAEINGVVAEICAGNRQVVEYGHPLFYLRPVDPGKEA